MSDTPRTDAQCVDPELYGDTDGASFSMDKCPTHGGYVPASFARLLERELNGANVKVREAREILSGLASLRGILP